MLSKKIHKNNTTKNWKIEKKSEIIFINLILMSVLLMKMDKISNNTTQIKKEKKIK